jgi:hypothetical protein
MLYALERESDHGSTFAVFVELSKRRNVSSGPVSRVWDFASNSLRWINRYNETGPEGLVDRSRRPHTCSHAPLEPIENTILVLRAKHPPWGARKLKARLEMLQPDVVWPAASTFGNILSRAGLTSPQKKRKRTTPCSEPFSLVTGPNQLWCMDFKGYFVTGDGKRCDPFTITDAHSRYLIRCQIVSRIVLSQVRAICEAAMREYGMPARIRTDNGAPFAGTGLLGLSKLSRQARFRHLEGILRRDSSHSRPGGVLRLWNRRRPDCHDQPKRTLTAGERRYVAALYRGGDDGTQCCILQRCHRSPGRILRDACRRAHVALDAEHRSGLNRGDGDEILTPSLGSDLLEDATARILLVGSGVFRGDLFLGTITRTIALGYFQADLSKLSSATSFLLCIRARLQSCPPGQNGQGFRVCVRSPRRRWVFGS